MKPLESAAAAAFVTLSAVMASYFWQGADERGQAGEPAPPVMAASAAVIDPAQSQDGFGGQVRLPREADGHYYADGRVNGRPVTFLIDTGATYVVLTPADAERVGVRLHELEFNRRMSTANGVTRAALIEVRELNVGRARVRDVEAMVIESGLDISLLGMNWLSRHRRVEATADAMVIVP